MKIPDNVDFAEYLTFIGEQESQEIRPGSEWTDKIIESMSGNVTALGDVLPWSKTHSSVRLRPGEISLWAGINGHKKSMLVGQVMLWVARQSTVCIASLEMRPESTLKRMCYQSAGSNNPPPDYVQKFGAWCHDRIAIYDQLDTVPSERILGMCWYAAREMGIRHIVIDSLMKCGIASDDYNQQKAFIDKLAWCAKTTGAHIHLVCHMRKGQSEANKPGKFDVKGASELTDMVDNVFVTWADKERTEISADKRDGRTITDAEQKILDTRCDQTLTVAKQRHGEWEGEFRLWFHHQSLQFLGEDRNQAMPFEVAA